MEMTVLPKDIPGSLPIAGVLPIAGAASGTIEGFSSRPTQAASDFSEKLSAALDKTEPVTETLPKKTMPKSVKGKPGEENNDASQSTLPVGVTPMVQQETIATPVQTQDSSLQAVATTAAANALELAENLLQTQNLIAAASQTMMGPTGAITEQVVVQAANAMAQAGTNPMTAMKNEDIQPNLAAQSVEPPQSEQLQAKGAKTEAAMTPKVSQSVEIPVSQTSLDDTLQETSMAGKSTLASTTSAPSTETPNFATPSANGSNTEVQPQPVQFTAQSQQAQQQQESPQTAGLDPRIQQDIVSVQVSTATKAATTSESVATAVKAESKSDESQPESAIGAVNPEHEPVVVSTTPKELSQEYMGEEDSESPMEADKKAESLAMSPVAFEKVMNAADPVPVAKEMAPQQRQDPYEVARQVMDGMMTSTDRLQSSQVIITLKPEHLGEVTVKVNVDGEKVTAAFHAASSEVRAILESSLPQLRQEMSQQGWEFDSNGVFGGMQEFLANQQQQQQAQEQQIVHFANHAQRDEYDDAVAFTNNGKLQVMSASAVDYRV